MVAPPSYVLLPETASVPVPVLMRLAPAPLRPPE